MTARSETAARRAAGTCVALLRALRLMSEDPGRFRLSPRAMRKPTATVAGMAMSEKRAVTKSEERKHESARREA